MKHLGIPATSSKSPAREALTVASGAEVLAGLVRKELDKLVAGGGSPTQRQNQIKRCVSTIKLLGELTGETLTERQLVKHPRMALVRDAIVRALEPWPEALQAVGEALQRLERGEGPAEGKTGT
jgi:hypothetical protein